MRSSEHSTNLNPPPPPPVPPTPTPPATASAPPADPLQPDPPLTFPPLDLEHYTEATRRGLYDLVVAVHFTPPDEILAGDWYPDYTPDQAGLSVDFIRGRWLAGWSRLEEAGSDLPIDRRHALLRIQADSTVPNGVAFHEV
jgi:hypothetical protein